MTAEGYQEILAPNVYYDRQFEMEAAKILPGEYYATARDMVVVTVLGSCVAACLRDRTSGIGGMNHFMLPHSDNDPQNPLSTSARYGTYAMEMLINHIIKLGAKRNNLEAKVFGGGNVLRGFTVTNVGQMNAHFVLDFLNTEKITVVAQDLLDIYPRKVYYFPKTGRAMVKTLKGVHNNTIVEREKDYESRLDRAPVEGEIELF
ncbi:MAG: chemoreceptor glutamine deamidase CheD [Betaproteobacteria bacterium]|nr:chemoreceptor glutamine deamidase CheD [Betaproteobacteria bacterium]